LLFPCYVVSELQVHTVDNEDSQPEHATLTNGQEACLFGDGLQGESTESSDNEATAIEDAIE
jgi:hypothetical protein